MLLDLFINLKDCLEILTDKLVRNFTCIINGSHSKSTKKLSPFLKKWMECILVLPRPSFHTPYCILLIISTFKYIIQKANQKCNIK